MDAGEGQRFNASPGSLVSEMRKVHIDPAKKPVVSLSLVTARDYIGDFSFIATHDTIIRRGIRLSKWAQFTEPANLDGYRSARVAQRHGPS